MNLLWAGIVVWIITAALFFYCLPRGGKRHRFVETELEPYIAVAFVAGVAIGLNMVLAGLLREYGS
jgi:hypothetical protein